MPKDIKANTSIKNLHHFALTISHKSKRRFFLANPRTNDPTDISVKKHKSIKQELSERKRIFSIKKQK